MALSVSTLVVETFSTPTGNTPVATPNWCVILKSNLGTTILIEFVGGQAQTQAAQYAQNVKVVLGL